MRAIDVPSPDQKTHFTGLQVAASLSLPVKDDPRMNNPTSPLVTPTRRKGHASLRRGRVSAPGHVYFLTFGTRDRRPVFRDAAPASTMAAALGGGTLDGATLFLAWVVMPDHVHLLMELSAPESLSVAVARIKSGSSRRVNAVLQRRGTLWASGYHDHALRSEESLEPVVEYLLANPMRAGLVARPEEYEFAWSRWRR